MTTTPTNWLPIRKILATFVAAAIVYIAARAGVDLGSADVNEAAMLIVTVGTGYLVPTK